ncbi:MAG: hypothetical protein EBZ93_12465, partial [Actinobacteria bacterium]|nr:hypothetical protein [Actinomycetota bacterium]
SGPDADRPGFDISAFWSRTGMAHLMTPAGNTIPTLRGGMGDHSTGVTFAGAISAALFSRERTGKGQMVTSSLLRQGVYTVGFDLNMVLSWGRHPPINNRFEARNPSVNTYQSSDGKWFFVVGVEGDRHWPPLARVVGKPELVDDPRFDNIRNRAINSEELRTILDAAFATRTMDEWVRIFDTEPEPRTQFVAQLNHFDGAVDEVLHLATTGIDHFLPRFEFHIVGGQCVHTLGEGDGAIGGEVFHQTFQGDGLVGHVRMVATHPFHVFGGQSDDQVRIVSVVLLHLFAAMVRCVQLDALQCFAGAPTDGLTIHGERAGRDHVQVGSAVVQDGAHHHRARGVAGADDEDR